MRSKSCFAFCNLMIELQAVHFAAGGKDVMVSY